MCDDSQNNARCNWDGGDCCAPHKPVRPSHFYDIVIENWDDLCSECQCLGPNVDDFSTYEY